MNWRPFAIQATLFAVMGAGICLLLLAFIPQVEREKGGIHSQNKTPPFREAKKPEPVSVKELLRGLDKRDIRDAHWWFSFAGATRMGDLRWFPEWIGLRACARARADALETGIYAPAEEGCGDLTIEAIREAARFRREHEKDLADARKKTMIEARP